MISTEHHQAVRDLAPGFVPAAQAEDGIIEAIENPSTPEILTVQWHPERLPESQLSQRLFRAFVNACARYQKSWQHLAARRRSSVEILLKCHGCVE
jgi:gamma-glutamyl-gamma-aminobutyrate hydrolase PuuD